jgi:hypothetical protein
MGETISEINRRHEHHFNKSQTHEENTKMNMKKNNEETTKLNLNMNRNVKVNKNRKVEHENEEEFGCRDVLDDGTM